jgi:hypothetical protein
MVATAVPPRTVNSRLVVFKTYLLTLIKTLALLCYPIIGPKNHSSRSFWSSMLIRPGNAVDIVAERYIRRYHLCAIKQPDQAK